MVVFCRRFHHLKLVVALTSIRSPSLEGAHFNINLLPEEMSDEGGIVTHLTALEEIPSPVAPHFPFCKDSPSIQPETGAIVVFQHPES